MYRMCIRNSFPFKPSEISLMILSLCIFTISICTIIYVIFSLEFKVFSEVVLILLEFKEKFDLYC
jgi:hypothetical protein